MAPGLARRFAFEGLAPWRDQLGAWRELREAARARVHAPSAQVFAGDVSFRMTDFASRNAERAGVMSADVEGHRVQDRRRLAAPAARPRAARWC